MKNYKVISSLTIVGLILTGCVQKEATFENVELEIKELTTLANNAIVKENKQINDVKDYIQEKEPELLSKFKDYDLRFDFKNSSTILLVCKNDIALYENISCNKKIIHNYTEEKLPCNFYVEKPLCI